MQPTRISLLDFRSFGEAPPAPSAPEKKTINTQPEQPTKTSEPVPAPAAPAFTGAFNEKDLEAAESSGYAKGYGEGVQAGIEQMKNEAKEQEKNLLDAMQKVVAEINHAATLHQQFMNNQSAHINSIAMAVAKRMTSNALASNPLTEIDSMIRECVGLLVSVPDVNIIVNATLASLLEEHMSNITFSKSIGIAGDPAMTIGDCRIEWKNGAAERNSAALWAEIESIVNKITVPAVDKNVN